MASSEKKLAGKVALVTGGSRGIGRATALLLANSGASVVVNYSRGEAAAEQVVREIERIDGQAVAVKADVGDPAALASLTERANAAFGHVDILVSNAGVGHPKQVVDTTDEEWQRVFDVDARATLILARALLPGMIERQYGRIVTISSIIGKTGRGYFSTATYGAAKAALIVLTMGIAREGAPYVTANSICPGWIDTGNNNSPEKQPVRERALREIPLQRLGRPEDIAETVLFLVSDGASYITGQSINVNGGLLMQ
ncbi:MAG: SDR family oxidoreductase [Chloroflexi bacterium]|nr:SDR family oxidoreductase [Chloroflexota bacterium]